MRLVERLELSRVRRRVVAVAAGLTVAVLLVAACSSTSTVSSGTDFDSDSKTAVVILGTRISGYEDTTNRRKVLEPIFFQTHWQAYDPQTLRLVSSDSLIFSIRSDDVFYSDDALKHWEISTTELAAGSYALTATFIHHTFTTFMPLKPNKMDFDRGLGGMSINIDAPVDPAKNFYFEAKAGQVIYLGHFEFVSSPFNSDRIASVNYTHDEAAARAVLQEYPGISVEMITLDLKAAR